MRMLCTFLPTSWLLVFDTDAAPRHPGAVLTPQTQHHAGGVWDSIAYDDEDLAGAFCVWLSREKRGWLSGRYVSCNWDVGELEAKKEEIVQGELLKMRMAV
jgi:hypothetical protein